MALVLRARSARALHARRVCEASHPSLALCFLSRSRPFVWLLSRTWIRKNTDCFAVYPFQRACVQQPPLLEKGCLWGRGRLYTGWSQETNPCLVLEWKRPMKKVPVSSVFNDSEGLYRTTVCRWLVRRPHHSARLMRFGSRGPREFATEMPWLRLRGIKAVQGLGMAMSTVASEKNRKLLFISNVFYKQWYLCVLFH